MSDAPPSGVEIERKFLVDRAPADLPAGERIEQGYLAIGGDGVEVRLRRRGAATTLTVKSGPAMVRTEEEIPIDERRFDSLWPLTEARRVTKTRHLIPLAGDLAAELDVYSGAHEGLLTAEIEFPSLAASEAFRPPGWLGREVTGDTRFANQALALDGPPPRMSGA
jgi:adenylate cyclase